MRAASSRSCPAEPSSPTQIVASPPASMISSASHSSCSRLRASSGSAASPSSTCAAPSRRSLRQSALRGVEGSRGNRYASSTHEIRPELIRDESTSVVQPRLHNSWQNGSRPPPTEAEPITMTDHLDYESIRADTVRQVAKLMAAAAITAPKSGGQLFIAGKHNFIETVIVDDAETKHDLAEWIRARGKERREAIWFRDADVAEAVDAVLFVGLADWYPPVYDCGACGYATCAEFLQATKQLRDESAELEFAGPQCNLRDIDLGIAVGSAAKTAAIHSIDARCQTRVAVAARKPDVIHADIAGALSPSLPHKSVGFDRRMPEIDFDALDLPATGTLPVGVPGAARDGS